MVSGRLTSGIDYCTNPCVFLNDTVSHLRLSGEYNSMFLIDRSDMREAFEKMFEKCWHTEDRLITDREEIMTNIEHAMSGIVEKKKVPTN